MGINKKTDALLSKSNKLLLLLDVVNDCLDPSFDEAADYEPICQRLACNVLLPIAYKHGIADNYSKLYSALHYLKQSGYANVSEGGWRITRNGIIQLRCLMDGYRTTHMSTDIIRAEETILSMKNDIEKMFEDIACKPSNRCHAAKSASIKDQVDQAISSQQTEQKIVDIVKAVMDQAAKETIDKYEDALKLCKEQQAKIDALNAMVDDKNKTIASLRKYNLETLEKLNAATERCQYLEKGLKQLKTALGNCGPWIDRMIDGKACICIA